jgi:hypothetical protein
MLNKYSTISIRSYLHAQCNGVRPYFCKCNANERIGSAMFTEMQAASRPSDPTDKQSRKTLEIITRTAYKRSMNPKYYHSRTKMYVYTVIFTDKAAQGAQIARFPSRPPATPNLQRNDTCSGIPDHDFRRILLASLSAPSRDRTDRPLQRPICQTAQNRDKTMQGAPRTALHPPLPAYRILCIMTLWNIFCRIHIFRCK